MNFGSQNSNPLLFISQIPCNRNNQLQPAQQQKTARPVSSHFHSSNSLSQSQQHHFQQASFNTGGGIAHNNKPFSQLQRLGSSSHHNYTSTPAFGAGAAAAGLTLPSQQPLPKRPATPPSQSLGLFSQQSQLPESDQILMAVCTQPMSQQQYPQVPSSALPNVQNKPLQQQHVNLRPGSSNSYDVFNSSRPFSSAKQQPAAIPAAPYNKSSLGKALGQELEGRKVLEAVESMQVREGSVWREGVTYP